MIINSGLLRELPFEAVDDGIVVADKFEICLDGASYERIFEEGWDSLVPFSVCETTADWLQAVLPARVLHVREQFASFADKVGSATQQVAGGPLLLRIDVRHRKHAATKEDGDFVGVDPVVLGLATVDRLHVQGVAKHKGDPFPLADVGEPVPGEHALGSDDKLIAVRLDRFEEALRIGERISLQDDVAALVKHANEHHLRV